MEKTAVKPPWKSLRDSHFPHSPGDDGAFHFTKNTSSVESAIYPQISRTKHLYQFHHSSYFSLSCAQLLRFLINPSRY
jgi:hypothetical protein